MPASLKVSRQGATAKGLKKLLKVAGEKQRVKVGILEGTGVHPNSNGALISEIAFWNEFGTHEETIEAIPARPFLRPGIRDAHDIIRKIYVEGFKALVRGDISVTRFNSLIGMAGANEVRKKITAVGSPKNAPSTIKQKGSSNPLVDTGALRQHITWRIV